MNTEKVKCPVCKTEDHIRLFPEYKGKALSSDWYLHENIEIYNACCKSCGHIYEAKGVRNFSFDFYDKVFTPKPMMKVFGKTKAVSRQNKAYDLLKECVEISTHGKLLEAGAGMGGFSKIFSETHQDWNVESFEPSASFNHLQEKAKKLDNLTVRRYTSDHRA